MSSFGGTVKLTGESEYKKALSEITSNLKVLNSEMKVVTSQYDRSDKSVENLSSQNDVLNKKIAEQKDKVDILSKALENSKAETGENSDTTKKWQTELNNAQAELNKLNKQVENNEKAMVQSADATDENAESVEEFGKEADDSGKKALSMGDIIKANLISEGIIAGLKGLGGAIAGVGDKFKAFLDLGESTKETQTQMSKLDASFKSAGLSGEDATKTMTSLTGVLGDMDRANEASNLLSKMSNNSKDLEANTRILTGVFAEYGNSIPTEGLAEGMQATAQMGSVQGVLADALEWQGVNLDEYNEKLETMSTAEERSAYIQSTLTDLYGKSADAYRENNKALIESNEAQMKYDNSLAEMGKLAMPINTEIKNISSSLIDGFMPALQQVMPSVSGVTGAFGDLISAVIGGEEGGIENAMVLVSEQVMAMVENLGAVIPQIGEIALNLVTTLVTIIAENLPIIIEQGVALLTSLIQGMVSAIPQILPAVMQALMTLVQGLLDNLPMILQAGITVLVELVKGITKALPKLIPAIIDAVILMVETLIDNIDLIIDAGIEIILALADGLLEALPRLIDKIPVIIDKLIMAITNNMPKIIEMGIKLTVQLALGLVKAIPQLASKIPQIISSLVKGFTNNLSKMGEVGTDLVKGLWNGIKDATGWILEKIKGFGKSVLGGIKDFFGIKSPSRLFKDEVGKNLALGVGDGFADTMSDVSAEMQRAIPTEFDADINTNINATRGSTASTYDMMVSAFKQALTEVKVVMDDREMGGFVTDTVERVVFA